MPMCAIVGCSNRPGWKNNVPCDTKLTFYKLPTVRLHEDEATRKLSEERRRLWKAAINRKDIETEEAWNKKCVCSRHFVGGEKAYLHLRNSPSWLPTLHLGYDSKKSSKTTSESDSADRYLRVQKRRKGSMTTTQKKRREESATAADQQHVGDRETTTAEDQQHVVGDRETTTADDQQNIEEGQEQDLVFHEVDAETDLNNVTVEEATTQTSLTSSHLQKMYDDLDARVTEATQSKKFRSIYERRCYVFDESKVPFYLGLPSLGVLDLVFDLVKENMSNQTQRLSKEQEFLLTLIKIRMNYLFQDIAFQLNVSVATVQRSFHRTLDVLVNRLSFLIKWPERENLQVSMPMCFRESFGKKVAAIVDCFEVTAEKPSGAANQIQVYSNYKHNQTVKYLIGITPQGTVSFISEAWGGRASDKHIIEQSGILRNLLPGDILMADRGFNISEEVMFYQAELVIPNFTQGKKQLHPLEVENTRKIASVRIHVERVIGFIRRKYSCFQTTVPIEFMKVRNGQADPTIDKMVKLCCCLSNLHPSVVPFD